MPVGRWRKRTRRVIPVHAHTVALANHERLSGTRLRISRTLKSRRGCCDQADSYEMDRALRARNVYLLADTILLVNLD